MNQYFKRLVGPLSQQNEKPPPAGRGQPPDRRQRPVPPPAEGGPYLHLLKEARTSTRGQYLHQRPVPPPEARTSTRGPYLHGEALPTAREGAAEGLRALVRRQDVALQVERPGEGLATLMGADQLPLHHLHPLVDVELVQMQEVIVVELLLALVARQLD